MSLFFSSPLSLNDGGTGDGCIDCGLSDGEQTPPLNPYMCWAQQHSSNSKTSDHDSSMPYNYLF